MKTCQLCSAEIQDNAVKCLYCGKWVNSDSTLIKEGGIPSEQRAGSEGPLRRATSQIQNIEIEDAVAGLEDNEEPGSGRPAAPGRPKDSTRRNRWLIFGTTLFLALLMATRGDSLLESVADFITTVAIGVILVGISGLAWSQNAALKLYGRVRSLLVLVVGVAIVVVFQPMMPGAPARLQPSFAADPAPQEIVDRVAGFLKEGLYLEHAYMATSDAHRRAFFFAAEIVGSGGERGRIGVWLILRTPDQPGLTISVNLWAREMSLAPLGGNPAAIRRRLASAPRVPSMIDPPASELRDFVAGRAIEPR